VSIPPRIGRYQIVDLLGQGAMGVVYRGRDEALDRDVAVKVVRQEAIDDDSRARFQREARAAAKLQHPHIVTVYELGDHEGAPFMAMELLEGADVQHAMKDGSLADPAVAVPILLQTLDGLGHAHARGIVHRDVKPSNIFLLEGRHAKVLDFGVARLGEGLTVTGHVVGTPHYMSPEQVRAEPVDGRSDLFSTALIFYEMVTGTKAFRPGSVMSVLYQIANEDADLSRLPAVPEWAPLQRVLRRALARDRDQRYPDARAMASAFADALREWAAGKPLTPAARAAAGPVLEPTLVEQTPAERFLAPDPGTVAVAEPVPDLPPARPTADSSTLPGSSVPSVRSRPRVPARPAPAAAPPPRSSRAPVAAAALLAFAAAAGGGWWYVQREQAPTSPVAGGPAASATGAPAPDPTLAVVPALAPAPILPAAAEPAAPPVAEPSAEPSAAPPPPPSPRPSAPAAGAPPVDVAARLARANDLYEAGRFNSALAEARAALRADPGNAEARSLVEDIEVDVTVEDHLKRARAALARGDREAARREVEEGLRVKPQDGRLTALRRELEG
jgi:serine/threonine-protein kinase